jgi:hypothetical protein
MAPFIGELMIFVLHLGGRFCLIYKLLRKRLLGETSRRNKSRIAKRLWWLGSKGQETRARTMALCDSVCMVLVQTWPLIHAA